MLGQGDNPDEQCPLQELLLAEHARRGDAKQANINFGCIGENSCMPMHADDASAREKRYCAKASLISP